MKDSLCFMMFVKISKKPKFFQNDRDCLMKKHRSFLWLREALFPSGSAEKLMSVLRSSSVRKIIDFCEGDLGGVTRLLSTGSLNLRFRVIRKWIAVNEVKTYRKHFRDLFWARLLWPFWRKLSKTQHAHNRPYPVGVWVPNQWSPNWRAATYERETLVQVDFPRGHCRMERSASRPCRARCI